MRQWWNFCVRFLVFGVIGWSPLWKGLIAEQRNMAEQGRLSQRQYAQTVGRMARQESLYTEVNVYFRMQGLAWGITLVVAAFQVYAQAGSLSELWATVFRWSQIVMLVHA